MRTRLLPSFLLFASLALGSGCGKKDEPGSSGGSSSGKPGLAAVGPTAAAVQDDVAKLVPDDARVLLYVPSLARGMEKVRALVSEIDADAASEASVEAMLADAPPPIRQHLDPTKPIAVVVSFPQGADEPVLTVIAPAKDPAAAASELEAQMGVKPVVSGSHLSVTPEGPPPTSRGGSALAKSIPAGDVGLRVDVAGIVQRFRPQIDGMLREAEQQFAQVGGEPNPAASAIRPMLEAAATLVDSAEWLDLALRIDGTRVDLDVEFRAKEGSPLAGKLEGSTALAALAGRLPKDFPVVFLGALDGSAMAEWGGKFLEAAMASMPEDTRGYVVEALRMSKELEQYYGREQAFGLGFGDQGLEGVSLRVAKDAKTVVAKTNEMTARMVGAMSSSGISIEPLAPSTIQGVEVSSLRMTFDLQRAMASHGTEMPPGAAEKVQGVIGMLFGPEGMVVRTAAVDGTVLSALGSQPFAEQAIASAKAGGAPSAAVAAAMARAGGKPALLMHVEARALARQVLSAVRKAAPPEAQADMPTVPDGRPATLLVHATGQGRVYRGGLSVEVGGWADLIKSLMGGRPPR